MRRDRRLRSRLGLVHLDVADLDPHARARVSPVTGRAHDCVGDRPGDVRGVPGGVGGRRRERVRPQQEEDAGKPEPLGDEIEFCIADNGIGFDAKNINGTESIGMKNIRSRIDFLNGRLDISSQPGSRSRTMQRLCHL